MLEFDPVKLSMFFFSMKIENANSIRLIRAPSDELWNLGKI